MYYVFGALRINTMIHCVLLIVYIYLFIFLQTYKVYTGGVFTLTRLLIPAWIVHYYVKYHVAVSSQKCVT